MCSSFCYFYLYSWIVSWWQQQHNKSKTAKSTSVGTRLLLSSTAAALNTLLTLPLDVISARIQAEQREEKAYTPDDDDENQNEKTDDESSLSCYEDDLDETETSQWTQDGWFTSSNHFALLQTITGNIQCISSYWKGLGPSLLLCSNPAINYTVFDSIKQHVMTLRSNGNKSLSMPEAFVLGLLAKFVATMATYPLIRAKVMLMVVGSNSNNNKQNSQNSLWSCLREEYRQRGLRGLYTGCNLQLVHTLLKSALLMMMRERIAKTAYRLVMSRNEKRP